MYPRTEPPFRADHVGSLLRPRSLVQARHDFAAGRIDAARLRAVEDEAIRDVVALQEDIGLRTATDGEFRRTSWHMDFIYRLGGVTRTDDEIVVTVPQRRGHRRVHRRRAGCAASRCTSTSRSSPTTSGSSPSRYARRCRR